VFPKCFEITKNSPTKKQIQDARYMYATGTHTCGVISPEDMDIFARMLSNRTPKRANFQVTFADLADSRSCRWIWMER
jgi:hypothetical protein